MPRIWMMKMKKQLTKKDIGALLLGDIRRLIDKAQPCVATTVNVTLTMLYWRIGKRINQEILKGNRAQYGKEILATLSQRLCWSHFRELLPLDKSLQRDFHTEMYRIKRLSVPTLTLKLLTSQWRVNSNEEI